MTQDQPFVSRHLVDPEFLPLLDMFPTEPLSKDMLEGMRAMTAVPVDGQGSEDRVDERLVFPGAAGDPAVEVLLFRPKEVNGSLPLYVYIHGGGFVVGSPEMNMGDHRALADSLCCVVAAVRYRLAPEHRYPAQLNDCYAALEGLWKDADRLGIDRARIAIGGESAGGALAAALVLLARDRSEIPICFQLLIFPMLDDRTGKEDGPNAYAGEFLWRRGDNQFGWAALLGELAGGDAIPYLAAPARAQDLTGLPPTFLYTGALDLLVDEDIDYCKRLIHAGIPCEMHLYPGAPHAFRLAARAALTSAAETAAQAALSRAFRQ